MPTTVQHPDLDMVAGKGLGESGKAKREGHQRQRGSAPSTAIDTTRLPTSPEFGRNRLQVEDKGEWYPCVFIPDRATYTNRCSYYSYLIILYSNI